MRGFAMEHRHDRQRQGVRSGGEAGPPPKGVVMGRPTARERREEAHRLRELRLIRYLRTIAEVGDETWGNDPLFLARRAGLGPGPDDEIERLAWERGYLRKVSPNREDIALTEAGQECLKREGF